jgi:hypothetical protein
MTHRLQCQCGTLQGEIDEPMRGLHMVCYCDDCQAFAHLLGQAPRVLDPLGGTDIIATQSRYVRFTSGTQALACLSLSPTGLLRWYAKCCDTPIANTPRNWKLPYAGLVHTCLRKPQAMEGSFPEVQLRLARERAKGEPPKSSNVAGMGRLATLMSRVIGSRLAGGYKATPFFDAKGVPVAQVVVSQPEAVEKARQAG